jgi:pSer/pThr/pTyr-binding forkhead associated (FHA) protein
MRLLATTTNYSAIIRPLQWLVIALIFLFFLRVVRAVFVEIRPAGARLTRAERRRLRQAGQEVPTRQNRRQLFLEVVEPAEYQGRTFDLDDELTIGRSPGCGVPTTYDVYSSTLHARLFRRGDRLYVEDLESTNGTFVNSERIARPTRLGKGDLLQVGATVFEVTR